MFNVFVGERGLEGCVIGFHYVVFRRENSVGKISVVGYKHKAYCVTVKSSCRKKTVTVKLRRNKVNNGFLSFIVGGGNHTLRLVEHNINVLFIIKGLSVNCNYRCICINLYVGRFYCRTVNGDSSAFYHFLYIAS